MHFYRKQILSILKTDLRKMIFYKKVELERPNQRQGAFLGPVKSRNHPGLKAQSFRSQKAGFSK